MPFHGASTICSPSSMALARTTSSSAVSRATLPISLRYIRTGSSIPIMSAEIASSSSAVGSSTAFESSLAGASAGSLAAAALGAVVGDDDDPDVGAVAGDSAPEVEVVVLVVVVLVVVGHGDAGRARRAQAGELGLFEVGLGAARPRQDGLDELLVEGISGHGLPPVAGQEPGLVSAPVERQARFVDLDRRSSISRSIGLAVAARSASAWAASL